MLKEINEEKLFHLGFSPGLFRGDYAILPGDPGRVDKIAKYLSNTVFVAQNREYRTVLGEIESKKVFVCSTGIGGPSCAIAVEELIEAGVRTFIRVGTCGGINLDVDGGDIVVASSAVRQEGTSLQYAPIEFPATADFSVTGALCRVAEQVADRRVHVGIVQSKDSFYGQHSPESSPVATELLSKWTAWKKLGVLASEMECSTLFTVASSKGVRAGAILSVIWNQERNAQGLDCHRVHDTETVCRLAAEAIKLL